MTPNQFCRRVQAQLLKVEREQAKLHQLLSDGVCQFGPELTRMGVNVAPLSGGTPKSLPGGQP